MFFFFYDIIFTLHSRRKHEKICCYISYFSALFLGAIDLQTASKSDLMEIKGIGEKSRCYY